MTYATIANVTMTIEAARSVEWAGVDVAADVERVRREGNCDGLLAECLEGCEPEHEGDWRDYVSAVCAAAEQAEVAEQIEAMIRHARHAAVGDTIGGSDGNAYRIVRFVSVDRAIVTLGDWDDVADDADGGCTPRAMVEASS